MTYEQFCRAVAEAGWTAMELRCDVRPSPELLEFIESCLDYESFVLRLIATRRVGCAS